MSKLFPKWVVTRDHLPDEIVLFSGSKTACLRYLRENGLLRDYRRGRGIHLGNVIWEASLLADDSAWMSATRNRETRIVDVEHSRCAAEYISEDLVHFGRTMGHKD